MKLRLTIQEIGKIVLLAVVYFITGKLGLKFFEPVSGFATLVWPPTGIALATLVLFGPRLWPGVFLGAFFVNLTTGTEPLFLVSLGIGIGNTLESLVGAYILRRFIKFDPSLERLHDVAGLIACGAIISTAVSATIGVTSLLLGGVITRAAYIGTWIPWWIGDMLGDLTIASFFLAWLAKPLPPKKTRPPIVEVASFLIITLLIGFIVFGSVESAKINAAYLVFIPIIWAALRFSQLGVTTTILGVSIFATWGTTLGLGPFAGGELSASLLHLQLFLGVVSIIGLLLGAVVTERHNAEKRTEEEKIKVETILKNIGDGVIVIDAESRILFMNPAAQTLLGWSEGEAQGKKFNELVPVEDDMGRLIESSKRLTEIALKTGKTATSSMPKPFYYVRKNKTKFPGGTIVTPIKLDGRIVGVIKVIRDITAETEIDRAKSEFVSLASHELRTPPTTIKWYTEMLMGEEVGKINESQRSYLAEIARADERMIELIRALLTISRLELGTFRIVPESVDVETLVEASLSELKQEIHKRHLIIERNYDKHISRMQLDPQIMNIIFHNLLSNAVKYSSQGGTILVTLSHDDKNFLFVVTDTGIGIPKKQQKNIFTKLFRADNAKIVDPDGIGLGLYLVKSILDRIDGAIRFESKERGETSFHISIPKEGMRIQKGAVSLLTS